MQALEIPLYKLFYDGTELLQKLIGAKTEAESRWGSRGQEHRELRAIAKSLSRMNDSDRRLLIDMASRFAA